MGEHIVDLKVFEIPSSTLVKNLDPQNSKTFLPEILIVSNFFLL
jgi:hypothetical protein